MHTTSRAPGATGISIAVAAGLMAACLPQRPTVPPQRPVVIRPAVRCPPSPRCRAVPRGWELAGVIVAAANIQPGTILSEDLVTTDKIPIKFRTANMVIPKELDTLLGNEVVFKIHKGDPLSWHHFRSRKSREDRLSRAVTKRGRAITLSVTERSSVGRFVRPADHVDIISLYRDPKTKQMRSRLLLQNIIVLAVGRQRPSAGAPRATRYRTVTLLVLPAEAVILTLAQAQGSLSLMLRNPEDLDLAQPPPSATLGTLTDARLGKLRQKRYQTIQRIRVVRGLPGLKR